MGKSAQAKNEKIYKLWYKYLQRSDKYKQFCELVRDNPTQDTSKYSEYEELLFQLAKERDIGSSFAHLLMIYEIWGDIHVVDFDFDDWWANVKFPREPVIVQELSEAIKEKPLFYNRITRQYFQKHGQCPSISDIEQCESDAIYLKVSLLGHVKASEIAKRIAKIRSQRKKEGKIKDSELNIYNRYYHPTGKVRPESLEDYLKIFDLKKNLTMKDVIKTMAPDLDCDDADILRTFWLGHRNAIKIIENTEEGLFPGEYSKVKK